MMLVLQMVEMMRMLVVAISSLDIGLGVQQTTDILYKGPFKKTLLGGGVGGR